MAERDTGYADEVRTFILTRLPFVSWPSAQIIRDADGVRWLVATSHSDTAGHALRDSAGRPGVREATVVLAPDEVAP